MITIRGTIEEREYSQIIIATEELGCCTPWQDATIYQIRGKKEAYVIQGKRRASTYAQRGDLVEIRYHSRQPEEIATGEEREFILLEKIEILKKAPKNHLERLL